MTLHIFILTLDSNLFRANHNFFPRTLKILNVKIITFLRTFSDSCYVNIDL